MEDRKRKRGLCFGVLGMVLCMAADWLLDVMPAGNVSNVLVWNPVGLARMGGAVLPHCHAGFRTAVPFAALAFGRNRRGLRDHGLCAADGNGSSAV